MVSLLVSTCSGQRSWLQRQVEFVRSVSPPVSTCLSIPASVKSGVVYQSGQSTVKAAMTGRVCEVGQPSSFFLPQ